jgi:hypothetical protein
MIRKSKGEFMAECDGCGHPEYGGTLDDFREFVEDLKEQDWKIRKVEDEWQHFCPDCTD